MTGWCGMCHPISPLCCSPFPAAAARHLHVVHAHGHRTLEKREEIIERGREKGEGCTSNVMSSIQIVKNSCRRWLARYSQPSHAPMIRELMGRWIANLHARSSRTMRAWKGWSTWYFPSMRRCYVQGVRKEKDNVLWVREVAAAGIEGYTRWWLPLSAKIPWLASTCF